MTLVDFIPVRLLMNPAGMVKVTIEYHRLKEPNFLANPLACWDKRS
jgi:hypothetical protein